MILVDTSVWVDHLRAGDPALVNALENSQVLVHPFVLGELACGNLRNRRDILGSLGHLPSALSASDEEAVFLIETRSLMGRGIGYIDVHLLASALLYDVPALWTRDKRLATVADELDILYQPERP